MGVITFGTLYFTYQDRAKIEESQLGSQVLQTRQGGTGDEEFSSSTLIAADGTNKFVSTSSPTVNAIFATSTTITSEFSGSLLVNNLEVLGSCTGCAGSSDFQDIYNSSAADAQILTTTGKDIVFFLTNTDANAVVQILSGTNGEGQLQIGTADGSATTTTGIWAGYGGLGIGTTSPGAGLAVNATSTILSGPAYVLDHLRTSYIIATSTQNNTFGGALDITEAATSTFTGGLSVGTGGLLSTTGITLTAGDLLLASGKITQASGATSTIPSLSVSTNISAVNVLITGDLNVDTGTSTLQGATFAGVNTTNGVVVSGDALFSGALKISSTATSTNAGTWAITNTTGTSTISGALSITRSLLGSASIVAGVASTTADTGTTTVAFSCTSANLQTGIIDKDSRVIFEDECLAGQILRFWIDVRPVTDAGSNLQIDLDGLPDANGEYNGSTTISRNATSTPFNMEQGVINRCAAEFMSTATTSTKANYALVSCDLGFGWQ